MSRAEALIVCVVPILKAVQCMITFCFALMSMSLSDSILINFLAESMTTLFFIVESTMTTFSAPFLSSNTTR